MAPQPKPNGFYCYMKEQQAHLKKTTGVTHTMTEMPGICKATWNSMSQDERAVYDHKAKSLRRQLQCEPKSDFRRKDNQRQVIAERVDPVREDLLRRNAETQKMRMMWGGQDLKALKLYVVNFQVMYIDHHVEHRLPLEVGMVCISMEGGILKDMHRFISPGDAPEGYRSMAMTHSEATHQIPAGFEHGDSNFRSLWKQIEEFVCDGSDEVPPIFCLSTERHDAETCLEFIHASAGVAQHNKLHRVFCLEDLASSLIVLSRKDSPEPSKTQILDKLQQNRWDYRSDIRCHYHEEVDCAFCSMSIAKRYSFALFDTLSGLMDFKLTSKHLPDETEVSHNVYFPPVVASSFSDHDVGGSVSGSLSNLSLHQRGDKNTQPLKQPAKFVPPKAPPIVNRVVVHLSEEDQSSSDSDDDEVLYTAEVKSTVDQYHLKELRLPKTAPLAVDTSKAAGLGRAAAASPLPMGRGSTVGRGLVMGRGISVGACQSLSVRPGQPAGQATTSPLTRPPGLNLQATRLLMGRGRAAPTAMDVPRPARLLPANPRLTTGGMVMPLGRGMTTRMVTK